jgi:hypothetical protein
VGENETLDFLLGTWRVERTVTDHRRGEQGRFQGTATFTRRSDADDPDGIDHVRFDEVGDYRLGDYHGEARRSLDYVAASGSRIAITFLDGHHFIDLNLASGESRDEHHCDLDRYEIATTVKGSDLLEEHWRVEGPEKNYEAVTSLVRVTGDVS